MKRAVLLGAGFSYAISSEHMPLTNNLGELVLDRLEEQGVEVKRRPLAGEGFEIWLSRLAEPQPDLKPEVNLANQSLFLSVTAALHDVLLLQQQAVLANEPDWWLRRFVGALHYSPAQTTLITFNYDMLVEYATDWCSLVDGSGTQVKVSDVRRFGPTLPYVPPTGSDYGQERATSFQLLKLHGSVDSYWSPGDRTGATINRWDHGTRFQRPTIPSEDRRAEVLPGRVPFLVPPAAAKSAFYDNPVSHELWQRAAAAIEEADEVALIGYSVPLTDLVTSGMLGDRLRSNDSRIVIVNPEAEDVRNKLINLGVDRGRIVDEHTNPATGCLDYTETIESRLTCNWDWPRVASSTRVGVGTRGAAYAVTGIREVGPDGAVVLEVGSDRLSGYQAPVNGVKVREIQAAAASQQPRCLLRWPDGNESWVAATYGELVPNTALNTLVLIPTAMPGLADA